MGRVEAVLFDLDGTLVRYERSPAAVLRTSFDRAGTDPLFSAEAYRARFDEFARRYDSMETIRSECFATLAVEHGHPAALGRRVAAAFAAERDQSRVELRPSAREVLERFGRRYALGIVTNGARDAQRRKIDAVGLDRWIETVVVAGDGTPPKPAPEPFARAIDSLGVSRETAVHVGDSPEADVGGATAAGIRSVRVSTGGDAEGHAPTYRVDCLADLLPPPWERPDADG